MEAIILLILSASFIAAVSVTAYSFGKASGIKWTKDVYDGKYDHEIFKDKLDT